MCAELIVSKPMAAPQMTSADRLRRFMNAYWLRPENALWMALRSEVLAGCTLDGPCIDLSCGDGVFSFLHAGGLFDERFDVFCGMEPMVQGADEKADMFDRCDDEYQPRIQRRPAYKVDVGTDFKPNLLTKAGRLGLYDELVVHDNNQPLPFNDGAFETVYCNAIYWVANIDGFLAEIRRITASSGRVLLEVKLDSVLRYTLGGFADVLGDRFLDIIGRGRAETWPSMGNRSKWEGRFERAGLVIEKATPFVTRTHAHIWDVGLRPIAPLLIELANSVTDQTRHRVKQRWVDLFCELAKPFQNPAIDLLPGSDEPAELLYELRPK